MHIRRYRRRSVIVLCALAASCTAVRAGEPVMPTGVPPQAALRATPLPIPVPATEAASPLAVSPRGDRMAVFEPGSGICVIGATDRSCTDAGLGGQNASLPTGVQVAFSPDGRRLAIGRDLGAVRAGSVWILDAGSGRASPVPPLPGVPPRQGVSTDGDAAAYRSGAAYLAMAWNAGTGHLVLVNMLLGDFGPRTTVVDLDPSSMAVRSAGAMVGSTQGFSGHLVTGGEVAAAGVYRGDQIPADLVTVNLRTGSPLDLGTVLPQAGTMVPAAISADGRRVVVIGQSAGTPGVARIVDLASQASHPVGVGSRQVLAAAFAPDGTAVAWLAWDAGGQVALLVGPADGTTAPTPLATTSGVFHGGEVLSWAANLVVVSGNAAGEPIDLRERAWLITG